MRPGTLLLVALALTATQGAAAQEADRSHWLRVRYQLFDETRGTAIDEETTIFRDGLVVTTNKQRDVPLLIERCQGTQAELTTLRRSLARNRVAEQIGDCENPFLGGQNSTVRVIVTWFNQAGGYHRFAVGRGIFFDPFCSQSTRGLVDDILLYSELACGRGRWQVKEIPPEPPFPLFPCEEP